MNIGIDARLYGLEHAGIGRYIINIVEHLAKIDQKNQYTLFLRDKYFHTLKLPHNFKKIKTDVRHYTLKEQLVMRKVFRQSNLDLVHIPHFNVPILYERPFVVTIHDLLWHQVKGPNVTTLSPLMYSIKHLAYRFVVHCALYNSANILVPSNWVKIQILHHSKVSPSKIKVTYEGIEEIFSSKTKTIDLKSAISDLDFSLPFIVYTGSAYPHKNVRLLIKAIKKINQQTRLQLVLVGSRSVFLSNLKLFISQEQIASKVIFAGFLSDKQLISLYRQAKILVHPSISEGFGLTGLEAMAVGLPVLASKAGSLPEIYSDAATYFDPTDLDGLTGKIRTLLTDKQLRQKLITKGKKRTKQFSWETTAKKTLKVYSQVVSKQHQFTTRI